jgi:hypothetical protein
VMRYLINLMIQKNMKKIVDLNFVLDMGENVNVKENI